MSESATKWVIVGAIVVVFLTYNAVMKRAERRRVEHFNMLASVVGARVDTESARFAITLEERDVEVRDEYRGGGIGAGGHGGHYVSIVTPLRGRSWDLHSVQVKRRFGLRSTHRPFEDAFVVEEFGLPMRKGWLTADVRSSLEEVIAPGDLYGRVLIEGGGLIYRVIGSPQRFSPERLRSLLGHLVRLAAATERAC
jgi:hypothetical protein